MSYSLHMNRKGIVRTALVGLAVVAVLLLGGSLAAYKTYSDNLRPVGSSQTSQTITIPSGSSVREIGQQLEQAGLIRKAWAFEWYVRLNGLRDKMQAGTYAISPNLTVADISQLLTHGLEKSDQVTILPAQRLDQIRSKFINSGYSEDEVDAALNPAQYADHPVLADKPAEASLEGYLYPETFHRTTDTPLTDIIRASLDEMDKRLTPTVRQGIAKQGLTVHQGIIIASIVEKEVSNADDKRIVAQVFLRRLREGMQLGSDVTAIYGAVVAKQDLSDNESIGFDSPYNTRIHNGLPPGPISNVGKVSLEAIANPATTDYLFFVAGDDGKTYFSHTQAQHEALTREHCKKLCFE